MNHAIYWLLVLLYRLEFAPPAAVFGQHMNFEKIEFDSECMKAMCIADNGCERKGCTRDANGRLGCGFFRMNVWQFKQVASRFRLKCYGKSDCETIARIHDGGANGCRTRGTLPYWLAVKAICVEC